MNENILDVLLYLFENYPNNELQDDIAVRDDLDEAGFLPEEVDDAFAWLRGTDAGRQHLLGVPGDHAIRLYADIELERLSADCQGYLLRLQHHGILSGAIREVVIDRLMALADEDGPDNGVIELEQLKWVVMMVLSSQADDAAYARMEAMLHAEDAVPAH